MTVRDVLSRVVTLRVAWTGMTVAMLLASLSAVGAYQAQRDTEHQADQLAAVIATLKATSCVAAWERVDGIRDGDERVYRRNAQTLIGLSANADPERVAAYKAQVERDVAEIRAEQADPACDPAAAKRRLR